MRQSSGIRTRRAVEGKALIFVVSFVAPALAVAALLVDRPIEALLICHVIRQSNRDTTDLHQRHLHVRHRSPWTASQVGAEGGFEVDRLRLAGRLREAIQPFIKAGRDVRGEHLGRVGVQGASRAALLCHARQDTPPA